MKTKISLMALLLLLAWPASAAKKKLNPVRVTDLRTERMVAPMSLDTPVPRLGWRIEADVNDVRQTSVHVVVSSTAQKAEALEGDLWDATLSTSQSQWLPYAGKELRSNTRCYWRVKVQTNQGQTDWSDVAMWNVGLLGESDWQGRWIGLDKKMPWDVETEHSRLSARYLRKEFNLKKPVRQATLYICGLGLYEAFINGQRVGNEVLAPAPTDYRRTVLYNAYDVTSLLAEANAIGVVLGNGRYYTMQQEKKPYKITRFGRPTLRLNLIVEFDDGTKTTIATDERWRLTADGPVRSNNEYDGETYDARKELGSWTRPGYDDSNWLPAERTAIPMGTLRGAMAPGMKVLHQLKPASLAKKENGRLVLDMGQNLAGWIRLRLSGLHAGDSVVVRFAERLDSAGNIWVENFRHAQSTDRYYASGREDGLWWHPSFVYHGFRYAEITGLDHATAEDFVAEVVSDEMAETGQFRSSSQVLNRVYANARWGVLSNYKGVPVDCPQRDERQPWLGDRTAGCRGEAFLFDNQLLYAKWMRDICEAQREDGCIPDVAPAFWNYYSDNVTWPAALPCGLNMLLMHYGDDAPLRRFYPNVKRWLQHLKYQYQRDGLIETDRYGDWCVPPEDEKLIHSQDPARQTSGTLISTAYYYHVCTTMSTLAERLGMADDRAWFDSEAALTREAFGRHFLTRKEGTSKVPGHWLYPDSTFYGNNTVTSNLLPYVFGMTDDAYVRAEVQKNIIKSLVTDNGGHVACGVIGISWLMHALTDMGRTDVAWLLATNKTYPSWGYMAEHGATTIWELWNGDTASPKMNSGNHVMLLGDLLSWLYECVAGIAPADAGFRQIAMQPDFSVDEIDDIDAAYDCIYGRIVSRWKKKDGLLHWHIELPPNTTAQVRLDAHTVRQLPSGVYDLTHPLARRSASVLTDEFLYTEAPFPQCHSASIVETRRGDLVCTFFGGTKERNPDVCIWVSRKPKGSKTWTAPQMVADGVEARPLTPNPEGGPSQVESSARPAFGGQFTPLSDWKGSRGEAAVGSVYREACWNPVLFETPDGELQLYFKIGPNVAGWKGWRVTSKDGGKTWSRREPLPDGFYGPVKNKPVLNKGRLIAPTSDERDGWKLYFELSDDMGKTWRRTAFVEAPQGVKAIQPTILVLPDGRLEALCRTRSRRIGITFSADNGETWTPLHFIDTPNNNSGIDAVTLTDGRYALICNDYPIEPDKEKGARTPLSVLLSDDGVSWNHFVTLEDSPVSQYSYPSIIQTRDGHLHAVYTWRRQRVKHVELVPDQAPSASPGGQPRP